MTDAAKPLDAEQRALLEKWGDILIGDARWRSDFKLAIQSALATIDAVTRERDNWEQAQAKAYRDWIAASERAERAEREVAELREVECSSGEIRRDLDSRLAKLEAALAKVPHLRWHGGNTFSVERSDHKNSEHKHCADRGGQCAMRDALKREGGK